MNNKSIENKHSKTALFAAMHRAIANKNYCNLKYGPDYIAELFLPRIFRILIKFEFIRKKIKNKLNESLPGLHEYMIARTSFFDDIFVYSINRGISQIVFLGAGYDSRALRFNGLNKTLKVFELDAAATQERKKRYLKKSRIILSDNTKLLSIDFNKEDILNVLVEAGFECNKKTLFIWEGVTYYLDSNSVNSTLKTIGKFCQNESIIAFDYMAEITKEKMTNYFGVNKFYDTMNEQHANESLKFTLDSDKLKSYLGQIGIQVIDHLDNNDIENKYLSNEDGTTIGEITGHFRFAVASPIK